MNGVRTRQDVAGPQQAQQAAEVRVVHQPEWDAAGGARAQQLLVGLLSDASGQSRVHETGQGPLVG